jgi:hypothetical protein
MNGHFRGRFGEHRGSDRGECPAPRAAAPKAVVCRGAGKGRTAADRRQLEQTIAGLPAHVMDELVADLAEAVVAMLLSQESQASDEGNDAGGDLRSV